MSSCVCGRSGEAGLTQGKRAGERSSAGQYIMLEKTVGESSGALFDELFERTQGVWQTLQVASGRLSTTAAIGNGPMLQHDEQRSGLESLRSEALTMLRRGQTTTFHERLDITERAATGQSDSEIAVALGCSMWTVLKWRRRGQHQGRTGLSAQMGRPITGPLSTLPAGMREAILQMRRAHPGWGPTTLLAELQVDSRWTDQPLPSRSRIAARLRAEKLTRRYQKHCDLPIPAIQPEGAGSSSDFLFPSWANPRYVHRHLPPELQEKYKGADEILKLKSQLSRRGRSHRISEAVSKASTERWKRYREQKQQAQGISASSEEEQSNINQAAQEHIIFEASSDEL